MKMNRIAIPLGFSAFALALSASGAWVMNAIDGYTRNYYWMYFGGLVLFFVIPSLFGIVRAAIGTRKRRRPGDGSSN